jgi:predicted DCC family thiol-disulfide oxidoreductase YuxK
MVGNLRENEVLFYDGNCGFCHRWVKFVVAKDHKAHFLLAPRDSDYFRSLVPEEIRNNLPPSILVLRKDGEIMMMSNATLYILKQCGGLYALASTLGGFCPRFIRDACYKVVSKVRHKLYAQPDSLCPVVPEEFRNRFKR